MGNFKENLNEKTVHVHELKLTLVTLRLKSALKLISQVSILCQIIATLILSTS